MSTEARFWAKVNKTDTCWLWTACTHGPGYGRFKADGFTWLAHRYSYLLAHGEVDFPTLDHLCRQPACVRPDHLEPVTQAENIKRGKWRRPPAKICKHGHPYTPENSRFRSDGRGKECWTCIRTRQKGCRT